MENFEYYIPTRIHFGKGKISELRKEAEKYGNRVLLVYGGGSIKLNGIYDAVLKQLDGFEIHELSGIEPNPRLYSVEEGIRICREHPVDVIIAVGGGSSIDAAKAISAGALYDGDVWEMILHADKIRKTIPMLTVLTLAATGSEMDNTGVITNQKIKSKRGFANDLLFPKASILDPEYTYTVNKHQTASGCADIMSHLMETYFNDFEGTMVPDQLAIGLLRTVIKYAPTAIDKPDDYEARANLMWAGSLALNGLTVAGCAKKWSCHPMQHVLGAYFDVTHGEALSILTPAWMRYVLDEKSLSKFVEFGIEVWGIDDYQNEHQIAELSIKKTRDFFLGLGLKSSLSEIGIKHEYLEELAMKAVESKGGAIKGYRSLEKDDVLKIYEACF